MTLESRANEEWGFFSLFGGLFFLGIFLGFLFLLATVLIIYYKQITEGYEDQTRFRTLQQVGMSKAEVRRTIHSQILTVFFLPLLGAGLHTVFAFPMISKMLLLFSLTDQTLQILTTAVTFLLFGVIYTAVYLLTSRFYYRIVTRPALRALPLSHVTRWERMGRNQALRHLHPNFFHTSPAPRPPGAEGEAAGGAFPGPKPEEAPLGQGRGVVGPPPVIHLACTGAVPPPLDTPPGPRRSVARGEDQAGAALGPEEQPRPGYGPHPVQLHRSRLPDPLNGVFSG
ncbi:MAG: ABC transporter permease [Oscillospiraceae bacterium]